MSTVATIDKSLLKSLAKKGFTEEDIYNDLLSRGIDQNDARQMIEECKRDNCLKQQKTGLTLLVIGSVFCFVSCIFTMLEVMPALTNFFLYGMTSTGVAIVFGGLIMVFEKTSSLA